MFSKKAKSTALVLLNNAVRQQMSGHAMDRLKALAKQPDFTQTNAYQAFCVDLCKDVLLQVRKQMALQSPSHARTLEKLVAHPETLYHESILEKQGIYTFPLLFGLLFFSLTHRTPALEDLQVVQQYFDKFLYELATE